MAELLKDGILLILGAVLGAICEVLVGNPVQKLIDNLQTHLGTRQARRRKALLQDRARIYQWLLRYHKDRGTLVDLHNCRILDHQTRVPFLTKEDWLLYQPVDIDTDSILRFDATDARSFEINHTLIAKRKKLGQRLYNEPALYLDQIRSAPAGLELVVKTCPFFALATKLIELEEETFRAVKRDSLKRTPVRDKRLSSAANAQRVLGKPSAVGCSVVLALRTHDGYEIILHTRSFETYTWPGARSVVPNYGMTPVQPYKEGTKVGILFYNFFREYLEELFDSEELIHAGLSRRLDPTWFYTILPEGQQLLASDSFFLETTGFGFDVLNGNAILALLARIEDVELTEAIKRNIRANWEASLDMAGPPPIECVDCKSPRLERWLAEQKYTPGTAFSISRALERLDSFR